MLGALGWAFAKLLFEPVKEIVDLRREAQEALIVHGNLSKDASPDDRCAAAEAFRRVGAGLVSRGIAAYPWVKWFCETCLRLDIRSAGTMLIGIGNTTQFDGFSVANASPVVLLIRNALRLPSLEQPPMIRELMAHAGRPAPIEPSEL
ncbi:MAG TPA: hypothetical protein VGZ49_14235 [Xanthobacteraceae bacterium]|nr:hypothetical protein [Xanthobacteraceae bacterium]